MPPWAPLAAACVLFTVGCGAHYVTRGAELYASGYYVEAAEVFERTEVRLDAASTSQRARYGLYRGATFLALGDTMHAEAWLGYSSHIVQADPDALSEDEHVMLTRALHLVASLRPSTPSVASGDTATVATTQVATTPTPVE